MAVVRTEMQAVNGAEFRAPINRAVEGVQRSEITDPFAAKTPEFAKHLTSLLNGVDQHRYGSGKRPAAAADSVLKANESGALHELKRFVRNTVDEDLVMPKSSSGRKALPGEPNPERYLTNLLRGITEQVKNHMSAVSTDSGTAVDHVFSTSSSPSLEKIRTLMTLGAARMHADEVQILKGTDSTTALTPTEALTEAVRKAELQERQMDQLSSYRRTSRLPEVKKDPRLAARIVRGEVSLDTLTDDKQLALRESHSAGLLSSEEWERRAVAVLVKEAEEHADATAKRKKITGEKPSEEGTITVFWKSSNTPVSERIGNHVVREVSDDPESDATAELVVLTGPGSVSLARRRLDRNGGLLAALVPANEADELQQAHLGRIVRRVDFGSTQGLLFQAELPKTEQTTQVVQPAA